MQKQLYSTTQKNLHLQYPIVLLLGLQHYYLMLLLSTAAEQSLSKSDDFSSSENIFEYSNKIYNL